MVQSCLAPITSLAPLALPCPAWGKTQNELNIFLNLILRTRQSVIEPVTLHYNQIKNQQRSSFTRYHMPYKVNY